MEYVIIDLESGQFLSAFDPDVGNPPTQYPTGHAEWTDDSGAAMKFPTNAAAMLCWQTQSTTCPLRPDGKPNRPLAAFSVLIETLEQAAQS